MITFKKFLEEVQYDEMDLDAAIKIINTKCKDAFWMIHSNTPFYRGDPNVPNDVEELGFAIADPSKTERKSANTTNYYTVILDNIPSMAEYPKRSKSFICTTSHLKARDFARQSTPYIIIPFDNVDIGVVNSGDLWDMSLDDLGKIRVTSIASGTQTPLDKAAAIATVITEDDIDRMRNTSSRLRVGSVLSRAELMLLALMSSENRAAHALARTYTGGESAAIAAMNRKAHALGMKVIIDWVANHTGWDHHWTTEHKDWYLLDSENNFTEKKFSKILFCGVFLFLRKF